MMAIANKILPPTPSKKRAVKERVVRDALSRRIAGATEVGTPSGLIDILAKNEAIEVKYWKNWKSGIGQVISYGSHYPSHTKRLHLFAQKGEIAAKHFELTTSVCSTKMIHVTFEAGARCTILRE